MDAAAPAHGPKDMPMKVTKDPALGRYLENCANVLVRNRITTMATRMVSGAPTPAPEAMSPNPKKKLIAGAILAKVEAMICERPRLSRCSRSPERGIVLTVVFLMLCWFLPLRDGQKLCPLGWFVNM